MTDRFFSQSSVQKTNRRLSVVLGISLVVHLTGLPPLLYLLDAGAPQAPLEKAALDIEMAPERENAPVDKWKEPEANPEQTISEPLAIEPADEETQAIHMDEPPIDLDLMWERPSLEPVSVRIPPRRPKAVHRPGKPGALSKPAEPTPEVEPPDPDPVVEPMLPTYPDAPPASLLEGLPGGALSSGPGEPLFDQDEKNELMRLVYSQNRYPEEALDLNIEGLVVVRFRLDGSGNPHDVRIANEEEAHASLQDEAKRMVEEGGPYPVPTIRTTVELFVAVAYLNTEEQKGRKLVLVHPSGNRGVDEKAKELAALDAREDEKSGWRIAGYSVRAVFDYTPGPGGVSARLVTFEGDSRWKRFLADHVTDLFPPSGRTGYLRIPIKFKITNR